MHGKVVKFINLEPNVSVYMIMYQLFAVTVCYSKLFILITFFSIKKLFTFSYFVLNVFINLLLELPMDFKLLVSEGDIGGPIHSQKVLSWEISFVVAMCTSDITTQN